VVRSWVEFCLSSNCVEFNTVQSVEPRRRVGTLQLYLLLCGRVANVRERSKAKEEVVRWSMNTKTGAVYIVSVWNHGGGGSGLVYDAQNGR